MTAAANAETYKQIFEDDVRGASILEDLVGRFSRPAVVKGGIDAVLETYSRAGNRAVIDYIFRRLEQANGVQPVNEDEDL
jgi:hypothetical protein